MSPFRRSCEQAQQHHDPGRGQPHRRPGAGHRQNGTSLAIHSEGAVPIVTSRFAGIPSPNAPANAPASTTSAIATSTAKNVAPRGRCPRGSARAARGPAPAVGTPRADLLHLTRDGVDELHRPAQGVGDPQGELPAAAAEQVQLMRVPRATHGLPTVTHSRRAARRSSVRRTSPTSRSCSTARPRGAARSLSLRTASPSWKATAAAVATLKSRRPSPSGSARAGRPPPAPRA